MQFASSYRQVQSYLLHMVPRIYIYITLPLKQQNDDRFPSHLVSQKDSACDTPPVLLFLRLLLPLPATEAGKVVLSVMTSLVFGIKAPSYMCAQSKRKKITTLLPIMIPTNLLCLSSHLLLLLSKTNHNNWQQWEAIENYCFKNKK
jgi:hypothetical protein